MCPFVKGAEWGTTNPQTRMITAMGQLNTVFLKCSIALGLFHAHFDQSFPCPHGLSNGL